MDIQKIEDKIDKTIAGSSEIQMGFGGVQFKTMMELMEFSKLMAVSGAAVPAHLRGNPGACLAIATRAMRFGFDPFALAEHSFLTVKSQKNDGGQWEKIETIAYDSFVIHAIIEAHAPITGRMHIDFKGAGDDRICIVSALPKGETKPLTIESKTLGEILKNKPRNDKGQIKGSPLWETKPDQQLAYDTRRDFCRRYFPEILMGWYDKDEYEEYARATAATDVTPKPTIKDRLQGQKQRGGFHAENTSALPPPSEQPLNTVQPETAAPEPEPVPAKSGDTQAAAPEPDDGGKALAPAKTKEAAESERQADEVRNEYLPIKIEEANEAPTLAALEDINASVRQSLATQKRDDLLGEWNATYLDRKRTLTPPKTAHTHRNAPALAPASEF